jgi:hypothetical protein
MRYRLPIMIFNLLFLAGCAGYQFRTTDNPFARYNIKHLSVPTFVNQSSIGNVSKYFDQKFLLFLSDFKGLKVTGGESDSSDGILIGVITSQRNIQNAAANNSYLFTQGEELEASIGSRSKFYVPKSTKISLVLRLVLIKKNREFEGENTVIFDRSYPLGGSFGRIISETGSSDSQGVVNYTKNRYNKYITIDQMSEQAVLKFRDLIVNVF